MGEPPDPSDRTPEITRLMPARAENARALYVVNLCSSHTPMPLEMPDVRGFFGLAVFRSRRVEDGRDRYRLHLGYFESRADAERALPAVQRRYPTAWIAAAPRSGLGSLDDTNVSEFRLISTPAQPVQPDLAAPPSREPAPSEVPVAAPQRYVVQLVWSDQRVDPAHIPQLAIYDAYTMYTVTVMRSGLRYYGIRLGFFTSVISARQIAMYVRPDFPAVAVVPISSREFDVARTIAWHRDARTGMTGETRAAPLPTATVALSSPAPTTSPSDAATGAAREQPIVPPAPVVQPAPAPQLTAEREDAPASPLEPVRVVSAQLVKATAPASTESIDTPRPAPIMIPERPLETPRATLPESKSTTMKIREEAQQRGPAFSREELLEALGEKSTPDVRSDSDYPPPHVHKRESAIRRLWHRLIG